MSLKENYLKIVIASSLFSKCTTLLIQLLAIPIAISSLGVDRFGVYVVITSLLSWLSLSSVGLFPGLTREVAKNIEDEKYILNLLISTLKIILPILIFLSVLFIYFIKIVSIPDFFGEKFLKYSNEIRISSITAFVCIALHVLGSSVECVRNGQQTQHINNLFNIFANLFTVIAIILAMKINPNIFMLVIAVSGVPALFKILNLLHYLYRNKFFHLSIYSILKDSKEYHILVGVGIFFMLGELATLLIQQGSIFIVGRISGPLSVGEFSVILKLNVLFFGLVIMITQPIMPILVKSFNDSDYKWVKEQFLKISLLLFIYSIVIAVIISFFGTDIIKFWTKGNIHVDSYTMFLGGLYFFFTVWNHIFFIILMSLGLTKFPTIIVCIESIFSVILLFYLVKPYGVEGAFVALLIPCLLCTFISYSYMVFFKMKNILKEII